MASHVSPSARHLAGAVLRRGRGQAPIGPAHAVFGKVVSIQSGFVNTVTIQIGGTTDRVVGVEHLASYVPTVGDQVYYHQINGVPFVLGAFGAAAEGMLNPMVELGDMIMGGIGGTPLRLGPIGPDGDVLTAVSGVPAWAPPSPSASTGGFDDPMTTEGDMIYEDGTPAPNRLPIGTSGQLLNVVADLPEWGPASVAEGDLLYEDSTPELARLPIGTDGQTLRAVSGLPAWADPFPTYEGPGSPEGSQTGTVNQSYEDTTNGALYLKVHGTGTTGWICIGGNGSTAVSGVTSTSTGTTGTTTVSGGDPSAIEGSLVLDSVTGVTLTAAGGGEVLASADVIVLEAATSGSFTQGLDAGLSFLGSGATQLYGNSVVIYDPTFVSTIGINFPSPSSISINSTTVSINGSSGGLICTSASTCELTANGVVVLETRILGGTVGLSLGLSASQYIGFYGANPITQPAAVAGASGGGSMVFAPTGGTVVDIQARAAIGALISAVSSFGNTVDVEARMAILRIIELIGEATGGLGLTA